MKKKRKTYGKTAKQWDNLYNKYKEPLKYQRGITKLTKSEFKEAWFNRNPGETVKDLIKQTRNESLYSQYKREYKKTEKKGFVLADILSEKAFEQQFSEYGTIKELTEGQLFVSKKQSKNWVEHAKKLGINLKESDALAMNEKYDLFWDAISALGGWEVAFEYGA